MQRQVHDPDWQSGAAADVDTSTGRSFSLPSTTPIRVTSPGAAVQLPDRIGRLGRGQQPQRKRSAFLSPAELDLSDAVVRELFGPKL